MSKLPSPLAHPLWALVLLAVASSAAPALAAGASSAAAKSEARYQRDAAVCLGPRYAGDKDECLSEASTARAGREPVTIDLDPERYARNALKRCEPLPETDRVDCIARMQGRGTTTGSVAGGGIYRELVTREAGGAPAAVPAK
jgi:hypothetical protein